MWKKRRVNGVKGLLEGYELGGEKRAGMNFIEGMEEEAEGTSVTGLNYHCSSSLSSSYS